MCDGCVYVSMYARCFYAVHQRMSGMIWLSFQTLVSFVVPLTHHAWHTVCPPFPRILSAYWLAVQNGERFWKRSEALGRMAPRQDTWNRVPGWWYCHGAWYSPWNASFLPTIDECSPGFHTILQTLPCMRWTEVTSGHFFCLGVLLSHQNLSTHRTEYLFRPKKGVDRSHF